jgi:hypothetical protein
MGILKKKLHEFIMISIFKNSFKIFDDHFEK